MLKKGTRSSISSSFPREISEVLNFLLPEVCSLAVFLSRAVEGKNEQDALRRSVPKRISTRRLAAKIPVCRQDFDFGMVGKGASRLLLATVRCSKYP